MRILHGASRKNNRPLPWHFHPHGDEGWFVFEDGFASTPNTLELGKGDFTMIPRGIRHSPEALVPNTIVIIFNRRNLGMILDDPTIDLGGFQETDLSKNSIE
jgi:hypothetical protein